MYPLTLFFLFIFGIILGSFASAIIYRERQGLSWVALSGDLSRSFCPNCKSILQVRDLIPLFSWLFQRGACRYCKAPIPCFYILLELFSAFFLMTIYMFTSNLFFTAIVVVAYPFLVSFVILLLRYRVFSKTLLLLLVALQALSIALTFLIYPIMG